MIKIICTGKLKEKFLIEAQEEYLKRLKKYTNIELIELNDSTIDDEKIALEKEKDQILKHIKPPFQLNIKLYIIKKINFKA